MSNHEIDRELRELYRSHSQEVDTSAFTDALGRRLAKVTRRPRITTPVRRAALAVAAVVLGAGLGLGASQLVRYFDTPEEVLVIGDLVQPAEGADQTQTASPLTTTVTTVRVDPEKTGAEYVGELAAAVIDRFPHLELEASSAMDMEEEAATLTEIQLVSDAISHAGTVSIFTIYHSDSDDAMSAEESPTTTATTTVAFASTAEGNEPVVTHPQIAGAHATYLIHPDDARWELIAKFPDNNEITVTSVAADTPSGNNPPLDGEQLKQLVELLASMLYNSQR